jgi:hypothetical protein
MSDLVIILRDPNPEAIAYLRSIGYSSYSCHLPVYIFTYPKGKEYPLLMETLTSGYAVCLYPDAPYWPDHGPCQP